MATSSHRRRFATRGNITLFVLILVVLFGFAALAIDLGTLHLANVQLQAGVDAAALAGASRLDGSQEGLDAAPATAIGVGAHNAVLGTPIALGSANVTTGVWDPATMAFTASADPLVANAVRVETTVPKVGTPFAGLAFGRTFVDTDAHTVAVKQRGPTDRLNCYLPIGIPECTWQSMLDSGDQGDHHFQFSNDSNDNVGWADPISPTPADIGDLFERILDGTCDVGPDTIDVGGLIALGNGVQGSTLTYLQDTLAASPVSWDEELFGPRPPRDPDSVFSTADYPTTGIIEGPVAIFGHASPCGSVRFNQDQPIVAFAWGVIFDVYVGAGQHKGLQLYVDTDHDWEVPYGGGSGTGNVIALGPSILVKEGAP